MGCGCVCVCEGGEGLGCVCVCVCECGGKLPCVNRKSYGRTCIQWALFFGSILGPNSRGYPIFSNLELRRSWRMWTRQKWPCKAGGNINQPYYIESLRAAGFIRYIENLAYTNGFLLFRTVLCRLSATLVIRHQNHRNGFPQLNIFRFTASFDYPPSFIVPQQWSGPDGGG